jgi:uncharacterized protein
MPNVTSHAPGTFCWIELATTDAAAGKAFYTQLFGWAVKDVPMGEGGAMYTMFQKDGADCAALYEIGAEMQGMRPNWLSYIAVDDVDRVTQQAKDLGASVLNGPFDVYDSGRMSVIADPQGGVFGIWKAKNHVGVLVRDEPGTLCWNELQARDVTVAKTFYSSLFGWNLKESPEYTELSTGDQAIGGILESKSPPQVPSYWLPYIAVEDCEGTASQAQALGARILVPAMDVPNVGKFSVFMDPQGAALAIIQLNF